MGGNYWLAIYLVCLFVCFSFCLDNETKLVGKSQVIFSEFHALIYDCVLTVSGPG